MSYDEEYSDPHGECAEEIRRQAAKIQSLTAEVARLRELREGMKPFAALGECVSHPNSPDMKAKDTSVFCGQLLRVPGEPDKHHPITFGDLRRAKELYDSTPEQPETGIREAGEMWAVEVDGSINLKTVSDTERAAKVNWLYVGALRFITNTMDDEAIDRLWQQNSERLGAKLVRCTLSRQHTGEE